MTILGPLTGEPPEPMTKDQLDAMRKPLKATLNGTAWIEKRELQLPPRNR